MNDAPLLSEVARAMEGAGVDLRAFALGWARVAPSVTLVPAFGLRAASAPVRAAVGLMLALLLMPGLRGPAAVDGPFVVALAAELARGLPVALAAAGALWAGTMAGGLIDVARGAQDQAESPIVEGRTSGLGVLFSILVALFFLVSGGPARLLGLLLVAPPMGAGPLERAASELASGIGVAVALAAPIVAAALVLEVALALVSRAAAPAQVQATLAATRSLVLLALVGLLFDRLAGLLEVVAARAGG